MKPSLQLRFSQQLTMTPQLQQAIKLLQLSSLELEAEILEALETNPLLERSEELAADDRTAGEADGGKADGERTEAEPVNGSEERVEAVEWDGFDEAIPGEGRAASGKGPDSPEWLEMPEGPDGLADHLLWQLHLCPLSTRDQAIAAVIVEGLNAHGYLEADDEELLGCLDPALEVEADELEAVRHRIQRLDPAGVGSRSLSECLRVQLEGMDDDDVGVAVARRLAEHHLEALARQDLSRVRRELGIRQEDLEAAVAVIRRLDPRPGSRIASERIEYVRPDVTVERHEGGWRVRLNVDLRPQLGINSYYAGLIANARRSDADYMRGQLQEARWLLKSLETRNETILKVAEAIVKHQTAFFEEGPEAMKPLVLREIAETIDMHESTVSRVTRGKFMATPRGIYEFKYFFSSHVGTNDGGECSATAIQAMIRRLVEEEPAAKPLSDARIASILNEKGISVARRTIAKYREGMNIPPSSQRKRLV